MAITVTLNEIGGNTSPYDGLSIGVYVAWNLEFTTTSTWYGKTISFNPALFIDPATPQSPNNTIQTTGFATTLPNAPATGNMAILTGPFSPTESNLTCAFNLISSTVLRINLSFIMTSDIDRFIVGQAAPSIFRFSKNINSNPNIYDNTTPSVYSGYKLMRGHLTVGDLTTVEDNAFADFQIRARFFDSGLTPGTSGEFTDWSFELTRGGQPVTNLSAFEDTTLTVTVDTAGAGSISPNAQILIFRESGAVDTTDFITDLAAGVHVNAALVTGIDYVASFTPWAVVAGTVYDCDILIDSDKIEAGATYRIIVTAFDVTTNLSNTNTTDSIKADALPDPVSGTMTGSISDYNDIFTGDCLQVATVERVKACVSVDKATYDAALSAQSLPGDFDTNFFSYQVQVVTILGGQAVVVDLNDRGSSDDLEITDTFNAYNACLTFRIRPEWAGSLIQVNHILTYKIGLPGNEYRDIVTYRQVLNAEQLEELEPVPSQFIIDMRLFDGNNDPVTEICEDFVSPLRVEVEKISTLDDYNLIAYIARGDGQQLLNLQEQEDYNNNILPQFDSSIILAVDTQFVADIANFTIEPALLDLNETYRVYATAKKVNLTPPVSCPVISIFTQTEVGSVVSGTDDVVTLNIDFLVDNYAPETVASVDIFTKPIPKDAGVLQSNLFAVDNGSYNYLVAFIGGFDGRPVTVRMDIEVTLVNGCTYIYSVDHDIIPLLGRITDQTDSVSAE